MHGNTETTAAGVKTRRFENILAELEAAFKVHRSMGSYLGGVHFELTGEDVTECTGGARGLADADLDRTAFGLIARDDEDVIFFALREDRAGRQ